MPNAEGCVLPNPVVEEPKGVEVVGCCCWPKRPEEVEAPNGLEAGVEVLEPNALEVLVPKALEGLEPNRPVLEEAGAAVEPKVLPKPVELGAAPNAEDEPPNGAPNELLG